MILEPMVILNREERLMSRWFKYMILEPMVILNREERLMEEITSSFN
jgi:hypothetical protein